MMRYLRKFNESITDDLQSFCNDNLAYLIDEGFRVKVDRTENNQVKIEIHKFYFPNWTKFTWDDVKDDVIPFLDILRDKYSFFEDIKFVSEDQFVTSWGYYNYFNLEYKYDDVIDDSFTLNQDLDRILREVGNTSDFDKIVKIEIIKKFK
jgi:hypothetical protein